MAMSASAATGGRAGVADEDGVRLRTGPGDAIFVARGVVNELALRSPLKKILVIAERLTCPQVWLERLTMKLDKTDIRILSELQKNGRISNLELAKRVYLSPSPCLMRVKKLHKEGFITGYSAQVDITKLSPMLTVFTEITLRQHRQPDFARFLAAIEKIDSVVECHLAAGGYDYLVKFVTAGITEYQAIMERLVELDIGIDKYFSFVMLKSPIQRSHLPLKAILPAD